jgi:hypothetical protein
LSVCSKAKDKERGKESLSCSMCHPESAVR